RNGLSPGRVPQARSLCHLGRLQEGRTAAFLTGAPRNAQRRSAAPFLLECGRQAGGVKHLDGRAISGEFKPRGNAAQNLSAITFAPGAPGLSRDLTGGYIAALCLCRRLVLRTE